LIVGGGFDHDAHYRFSAAGANEYSPGVAEFKLGLADGRGESVEHIRVACGHSHVHEHLRKSPHYSCQVGEAAAAADNGVGQQQAAQQAITGTGKVTGDHMATLLTAERKPSGVKRIEHVAVAHCSVNDGDALSTHRMSETEIGHDGDDDCVVAEPTSVTQVDGEHCHYLIAVDNITVVIDSNETVGVPRAWPDVLRRSPR
jgi:hypothetical protein